MKNEYKEIINAAIEGRKNAYAPYSKFKVGAAAMLIDGTIIKGCNVESASYGLSSCAERNTVFSLISLGYDPKKIKLFCVVGDTLDPISPCGACRQVLAEFLNPKTPIILTNLKGDIKETNLEELIPYTFLEIENE